MSKKQPVSTSKKSVKTPQTKDSNDAMQSLMTVSLFDEPVKKKVVVKGPTRKELEIDFINDAHNDIIRKLVLNINTLREELNEYKHYVEGTYCTQVVHDRSIDTVEKRLDELTTTVEEIAS